MTDVGQEPDVEDEAGELEEYTLGQDVVIKGAAHSNGDTVLLTEEEHEALVAAGVVFEGDEAKTEEEVQSAHDEAVEAQKAEIDKRAEADKAKKEKLAARAEEDAAEEDEGTRLANLPTGGKT